jgi:PhnO protein
MIESRQIRRATEQDCWVLYRMLCELEGQALEKNAFEEVFKINLANESIIYMIAEIDGRPIGMASCHMQWLLHHAGRVAEIQEMFVEPTFRSKGIGKDLVIELADFARAAGALHMEVTSNRIRLDTHRFYEKEGFVNTHFKLIRKFI